MKYHISAGSLFHYVLVEKFGDGVFQLGGFLDALARREYVFRRELRFFQSLVPRAPEAAQGHQGSRPASHDSQALGLRVPVAPV